MALNLTPTIAGVLDTVRGLIGKDGAELEFFEYVASPGSYPSLGTVLNSWVGYSQQGSDGRYQEIIVTDGATVHALSTATRTVVSQPNVGDELTVGGKVYEFVASGALGDQINIGDDTTETAANIAEKVTDDTADTLCTATSDLTVVTLTANEAGTNDIDLESDGVRITGAAFAGGLPSLETVMTSASHVRIGDRRYQIQGSPERPIDTLEMIRFWQIRCEHTGELIS